MTCTNQKYWKNDPSLHVLCITLLTKFVLTKREKVWCNFFQDYLECLNIFVTLKFLLCGLTYVDVLYRYYSYLYIIVLFAESSFIVLCSCVISQTFPTWFSPLCIHDFGNFLEGGTIKKFFLSNYFSIYFHFSIGNFPQTQIPIY